VKKNEMGGAYSMCGEKRGAYTALVEKTGRGETLGRPSCKWEGNINTGYQEVGWRSLG